MQAPFRRRQVRPTQPPRDEILTIMSHHAEKRVVGLEDLPSGFPDENPDDVSIDQSPDLCFAFYAIAVQTGVLERDRRLRGKELQHRDTGPRESPGSQEHFSAMESHVIGPGSMLQEKKRT